MAMRNGNIKVSNYGPRSYTLAANNPAILWDKENVLAIRIFDTGGDGGIYGDKHYIAMSSLLDNVSINTDEPFDFGETSMSKSVSLVTNSSYNYNGALHFTALDPETDKVVIDKTVAAGFSAGKPYIYFIYHRPEPEALVSVDLYIY